MLDAAHGEAVSTAVAGHRIDNTRVELKATGIGATRLRRRRPKVGIRADAIQGSRRVVAEARSRRVKAIARMNGGKNAF